MKKLNGIGLVNILTLSLLLFGTSLFVVSNDIDAASKTKELTVSMPSNTDISTERILNAVLKRMGYEMNVYAMGMSSAVASANSGDTDILAKQGIGLEKTNKNLACVPFAIGRIRVVAYTNDKTNIDASKWEDLKGLRIGVLRETYYVHNKIKELLNQNYYIYNVDDIYTALTNEEVDVIVLPCDGRIDMIIPGNIKKLCLLETVKNYVYVNKRNEGLIPEMEKQLKALKREGELEKLQLGKFTSDKKRVVHISSYSLNSEWERQLIEGLKTSWSQDENILYFNFNLDSGKLKNKEQTYINTASNIRNTFREAAPDVIVVSDNEALEFVTQYYAVLFGKIPVVFCGVNDFDSGIFGSFRDYATGCTESISLTTTIQEILSIYPETKSIYLVNDYSDSGRKLFKSIEQQLLSRKLEIDIQYNSSMTHEELKKELKSLPDDTRVLVGSYSTDSENVSLDEIQVQQQIFSEASTPVFSLLSSYVGNGCFGGFVSSAKRQGQTAGGFVKQILAGENPRNIPVLYSAESLNEWIFDERVAGEFHINTKLLPEGSRLINKTASEFGIETQWIILFTCLGVALIIAGSMIFIHVIKKKNAKYLLEQREQIEKEFFTDEDKREQELFLHFCKLMEHAPIAFFVSYEGSIIKENEYSRSEIGLQTGENVRNRFKDPQRYDRLLRLLQSHGGFNNQSAVFLNEKGESSRYNISAGIVSVGEKEFRFSVAVNVESLAHLKEYMMRSKNDLQKIIDVYPAAMVVIDIENTHIEYANEKFLQIYGCSNTKQMELFDITPLLENVFASWQGGTVIFEYNAISKLNEDINIKFFADQIVYNDRNCIVLIGQDITKESLREKMLLSAAEKEKEANLLKSAFLANMSHEIRTPMNAIIGLSQLAMLKEQSSENTEFFYKINSSANNLLSIINDILDFSKIEAEKLDFAEEEFYLEETISNAFLVASEHIEDKPVEILLDVDPDVPCYLLGDKTRVWQVLKNLIDNAVKYTPSGRVVLSVQLTKMSSENVSLKFIVKDDGIGMSDEQLERLYQPFIQFSRNSAKRAGTGLGMSITKQLVDMMQGTIDVESRQGEGTMFAVEIPFKRSGNRKTFGDLVIEMIGGHTEKIGTVLLVDDDNESLSIMSAILATANIESICVNNGEEAIRIAKEYADKGTPFKIVIVDYLLGGENGIEIGRQIKTHASENTKLLLVTAYIRRILSSEVWKSAGFKNVIEKPFVVSSFLQKVCSTMPVIVKALPETRSSYPEAKVLLCEDNEINQMVAAGLLKSFDITIDIAENGVVAIDMMKKKRYDLIFMDIVMPQMDGYETTEYIRREESHNQHVPIVAMTANVMKEEIEKCLEKGMNAHIEKPVNIKKIEEVLKEYL